MWFALFIGSLAALDHASAVVYTKTEVIDELLQQYDSFRFLLDEEKKDNKSTLYLNTIDTITKEDDVYIHIDANRFDSVKFTQFDEPMKLCDFLLQDMTQEFVPGLAQFQLSQIFNWKGTICPIPKGRTKVLPYIIPSTIKLHHDMGCGEFQIVISLMSRNDKEEYNNLITAVLTVNLLAEDCSNNIM